MRGRLRLIEARVLPRGWPDVLRQVGIFAAAYVLYQVVRGLIDGGSGYKPFGDATKIIDLERIVQPVCSFSKGTNDGIHSTKLSKTPSYSFPFTEPLRAT